MNVARFSRPTLFAARVVYFTDMTNRDAKTIPLGVFCEIKTEHVHGLALKARSQLGPPELGAVAPIFRNSLTNPFSYLSSEFDAAWSREQEGALDFLAHKHFGALSVLAPYQSTTVRTWWRDLLGGPELDAMLKDAVSQAFDSLMTTIPTIDGPNPTMRLQLAA
jgi:hypothetical protein